MTSADMIRTIAQRAGLPQRTIRTVLQVLWEVVCEGAPDGAPIPGLGRLVLLTRLGRLGRNPQTGEVIKIPTRKLVKVRVSSRFRDAVLARAAACGA